MSQLTREQIECFRTALRNWTSRDGVKVQGRWEALCDMALSSLAQPAQPAPDAGEVERAFAWLNSQGDWGAREATSTIHALQRTNEQQAATIAGLRTTLSMRGKSTLAELPTFLALQAERDALRGQVAELERKVFVPGLWRCAKCKLNLTASILSANDGGMAANCEPQQCPNECGPMWRVTERDERQEAQRSFSAEFDKREAAESTLAKVQEVVGPLVELAKTADSYPKDDRIARPREWANAEVKFARALRNALPELDALTNGRKG